MLRKGHCVACLSTAVTIRSCISFAVGFVPPGRSFIRIENANRFYPAEEYHQDFARKNPNHPYIRRWDAPKVVALREMYPTLYRAAFQTG